MSAVNREQGLFIATLAIGGFMIWSTLSDAYKAQRVPSPKYLDPAVTIQLPELRVAADDSVRFDPSGRDFFQPPKDWNPLPPMVLATPPLPEISAVGPLTDPSVELDLVSLFRQPPLSGAVDHELALPPPGEGGSGAGGSSKEDVGSGSSNAGVKGVGDTPDQSELYDWIKIGTQPRRLGFIRNKDKIALLDNREPVLFEQVDVKKGTGFGGGKGSPFEREKLAGAGAYEQGFGFADTVPTRFALLKREVRPSVANISAQLEAARTALSWRDENDSAAVEAAEWFVDSALSHNPKDDAAWGLKASIRRMALDTEGELEVYAEAERQGARATALTVGRARALRRLGLNAAAGALLEGAISISPGAIEPYIELGRMRLAEGRASDAIVALERGIDVSGAASKEHRVEVRTLLARAQFARGDFAAATSTTGKIFALSDSNEDAFVLRAVISLAQGDPLRARGELAGALETNPRSRDAAFNLAVAATLEGDVQEARARYAEAWDLSPLFGYDSEVGLGVLEELLGNLSRANEHFVEALLLHPNQPFGLYRAGRAARRLQDVDRAESLLRSSLEVDGRIVDVLNELALVAILTDEPEEAEIYARESLAREPENREVLVLLGASRLRQGRIRDAREAFEQAVSGAAESFRLAGAANSGIAFCRYREGDVEGSLRGFAEARATAEAEGDEFFRYADQNQAAIEDHHNKEQWIDGFDRPKIVNGWEVMEGAGPAVRVVDAEIRFEGEQRNSEGGVMTELLREVDTPSFVLVEGLVKLGAASEGMVGVRWVLKRPVSQKPVPTNEIAAAMDRSGKLYVFFRTGQKEDDIAKNWELVDLAEKKISIDPSVPHVITIERLHYEEGRFAVKVDGRLAIELQDRSLRNLKWDSQAGPFVRADARRRLDAACESFRVVRYKN